MPEEGPTLVELVEKERVEKGLTQAEVARACGLTQGHYSKLRRQSHAPGRRIGIALADWLASHSKPRRGSDDRLRIASLAASIREDCAELVRLSRRASTGVSPGELP